MADGVLDGAEDAAGDGADRFVLLRLLLLFLSEIPRNFILGAG